MSQAAPAQKNLGTGSELDTVLTPQASPSQAQGIGLASQLRTAAFKLLLLGCRSSGAAFIKWGQWSSTREDIFPAASVSTAAPGETESLMKWVTTMLKRLLDDTRFLFIVDSVSPPRQNPYTLRGLVCCAGSIDGALARDMLSLLCVKTDYLQGSLRSCGLQRPDILSPGHQTCLLASAGICRRVGMA